METYYTCKDSQTGWSEIKVNAPSYHQLCPMTIVTSGVIREIMGDGEGRGEGSKWQNCSTTPGKEKRKTICQLLQYLIKPAQNV